MDLLSIDDLFFHNTWTWADIFLVASESSQDRSFAIRGHCCGEKLGQPLKVNHIDPGTMVRFAKLETYVDVKWASQVYQLGQETMIERNCWLPLKWIWSAIGQLLSRKLTEIVPWYGAAERSSNLFWYKSSRFSAILWHEMKLGGASTWLALN